MEQEGFTCLMCSCLHLVRCVLAFTWSDVFLPSLGQMCPCLHLVRCVLAFTWSDVFLPSLGQTCSCLHLVRCVCLLEVLIPLPCPVCLLEVLIPLPCAVCLLEVFTYWRFSFVRCVTFSDVFTCQKLLLVCSVWCVHLFGMFISVMYSLVGCVH